MADFQIQVQQKASNGRYLKVPTNEIKVPTPPLREAAILVAVAAAVWRQQSGAAAATCVATWLCARGLSCYETEAAPGFGLLGNLVVMILRVVRHLTGSRPMQALLDVDGDPRMAAHLKTVREQTEKMMAMQPKEDVDGVEEISVTVRDGSEIIVRLTFPKEEEESEGGSSSNSSSSSSSSSSSNSNSSGSSSSSNSRT